MHRLTEIALRWPWLTIAVAALVSALGAWGSLQAPSSSGAHALIGANHPEVLRLERFLTDFGGGYPVVIAWSCDQNGDPCTSALDSVSLSMAHEVSTALGQSPHVRRVASPSHAPVLLPSDDGLEVHRLFVDGSPPSPAAVQAARTDPMWQRTLISPDGHTGAIAVESTGTSPEGQVALVEEIERIIAPHTGVGFRFRLSGNPLFHIASQREATAEAALIGAATALVISIGFMAFLRSWQSVLGLMTTVSLASGCALGTIAAFSWPWDPLTSAAPTLVLVMGSADAVHYLTAYWRIRSHGSPQTTALGEATRETSVPCAMTTATSMAGLVSFLGTESTGFGHFGAVTAVGVGASLVMTFTVLPAVLLILPDSRIAAVRESDRWEGLVARLVRFPIANARWVLLASALLAAVGAFGLTRLTADAHPLSYWREGHPTREAFEFVASRMSSIEGVELRITTSRSIEEPGSVARLEEVERRLRDVPGVTGVRSFTTVLESSARALGADDLNDENVGEIRALVSMSDPTTLDGWLSLDAREVRLSISAEAAGVESRERLLRAIAREVRRLPSDWRVETTGPSVVQCAIDRVVRDSALRAFSGTTMIVALLVMLFLGSVAWGTLAMIPNLLPMIVLFGLMGLFGIALDAGTALVAPIAIGIAVDDTVHFLHEFGAERRRGFSPMVASQRAAMRVGRAIVTTSGTLAAGFLAMLVSRFQSMANVGLLSAACIVAAFAAELLVLPALIFMFRRGSGEISRNASGLKQ